VFLRRRSRRKNTQRNISGLSDFLVIPFILLPAKAAAQGHKGYQEQVFAENAALSFSPAFQVLPAVATDRNDQGSTLSQLVNQRGWNLRGARRSMQLAAGFSEVNTTR
jgi:hypothetical protein